VFEITVDGQLKFSRKALGRFPTDAELAALVQRRALSRPGRSA
jgi:hypothetical protein